MGLMGWSGPGQDKEAPAPECPQPLPQPIQVGLWMLLNVKAEGQGLQVSGCKCGPQCLHPGAPGSHKETPRRQEGG